MLDSSPAEVLISPFWLHLILLSEYLPAWRQRMQCHERDILCFSKSALTASIEDVTTIKIQHEGLGSLGNLEKKLIQEAGLIDGVVDLLDELSVLLDSMGETTGCKPKVQLLKNHRRHCIAYSRLASNLRQQTQSLTRLIADTLNFRDQHIAGNQNDNIIFITKLSLVYLPPSFIAVCFTARDLILSGRV